jgi:glucan phosphoethanolaminetransferase (alkaline phosphatase superfamily)
MKNKLTSAALLGSALALLPSVANAQTDTTLSTTAVDTAAVTTASAGLAVGSMIFIGVISVIGLALFIFWIFMIIDVFKRTNWKQPSDKTLWIVIVILLGYLGAIVYYFAVKRALDKNGPTAPQNPVAPNPPMNTPPSNPTSPAGNTPPPPAPPQQ